MVDESMCVIQATISSHKGLVINYGEGGGATKREGGGGRVKFCPYKKGGGEVLAMLKGGAEKVLG